MSKYAKLIVTFSYLSNIMYHIIIDNQKVQSLDSKAIAFANFRSLCRDYKNKPSSIKLMLDDELIKAKSADLQLLDDVDEITANSILKKVCENLNLSAKDLKSKLKDTPLNLSNSRIDGWFRDIGDRKYTSLHNDELYAVLDVLLTHQVENIKTPANILKLRNQLNLTQSQLAENLGMTPTHRQVARWEAGTAEMPDRKWTVLLELLRLKDS